jgi:hypothetical protein
MAQLDIGNAFGAMVAAQWPYLRFLRRQDLAHSKGHLVFIGWCALDAGGHRACPLVCAVWP